MLNFKLEALKLQEIRQLLEQAAIKSKELQGVNKDYLTTSIISSVDIVMASEVAIKDMENDNR